MADFASITLIGRATADPKVIDNRASVSVAINRYQVDRGTGERKNAASFYEVSAFDKLADVLGQYVKKGDHVHVEGTPEIVDYTTQAGEQRRSVRVTARAITLLGNTRDADDRGTPTPKPKPKPTRAPEPSDDEIPF